MDQTQVGLLYEQSLEAGRRRDYAQAARLLERLLVETDQIPEALLYLGPRLPMPSATSIGPPRCCGCI